MVGLAFAQLMNDPSCQAGDVARVLYKRAID